MIYTRNMLFWLLSLIGFAIIGIFLSGAYFALTCISCDILQRAAMFIVCSFLSIVFLWGFAKQTKKVEISEDSIALEDFIGRRIAFSKVDSIDYHGGTIYGSLLNIKSVDGSARITNYSYFGNAEQMIEELEGFAGKKIFLNPWLKR
jgi:hypothetical protein